MKNEPTYITGGWNDTKLAYMNNYSLEMGLNLRAVNNREKNQICNLTIN